MTKSQQVIYDISGVEPQANFSDNPSFQQIVAQRLDRRQFLRGAMALAVGSFIGTSLVGCDTKVSAVSSAVKRGLMGFEAVAVNRFDSVTVPTGYTAKPF